MPILWTGKSLGQPKPGQCTGNPCNAATGNKYQNEEDYRSGDGRLVYTRVYNSQANEDIGFGFNWTSSFHKRLKIFGSLVQLRRSDGRGEPFTCPGSGSCQGDGDTQLLLSEDASGYTLTLRDNATERYDLNGRITSQTDAAGKITVYSDNTNGQLATVTGPFGHQLTFAWASDGGIASITDPAGQLIRYTRVSLGGTTNLTRVDYPDGTAKIYYYEDTHNLHNLTGVALVDANNVTTRFSTYGYYYNPSNTNDPSNGKAILTEHAITDNTYNQEKFTLAYDTPATGQTTVTDSVNMQEVMTFAVNLGVKNLVSKVNQSDSKSLTQAFDANNNLTCRKDEEGRVVTYTYNATNQRLSMTEGLAGDCSNPPSSTSVTSVTRTTAYQYVSTTLDLPTVITSPSVYAGQNKTTAIQYTDASHPNLPTVITVNGYTPSGGSVSRSVALAYYDSGYVSGQLYTLTDPDGNVTTFNYNNCNTGNGCGQLSSVINALGQITTYDSYDANGRLLQKTEPSGIVTVYTYDPRGRVKTITQTPPANPPAAPGSFTPLLGQTTTPASNDGDEQDNDIDQGEDRGSEEHWWSRWRHHHRKPHPRQTGSSAATAAVGTSAATTALAPAALAPLATTGNALWQYSYTPWGDVSQVIDPDGVVLNYQYDAAHYLRFIVDAAGNYLHYNYDLKGNRTVDAAYDSTGALKRTVSYSFDLRNHLASVTEGSNLNVTQLVFDAVGNLSTESPNSDGVNRTTQYQYDALNRLVQIVDAVNGTTAPTRLGYDPNDRPTAVTAPNNLTTRYQYDDLGNRLSETSPDRGTISYGYDAAGNVLAQTDARGQVTSFGYDALNRLTSKQSSANYTQYYNFLYDTCYVGRLCTVNDGAMPVTVFGYDGLGRMNYSRDGYSGLTTQFAYTAGGRLNTITDPGGRSVNYQYDFPGTNAVGHVIQVSTSYNGTTTVLANNLSYYPFGPESQFSFGNGLSFQAQYDSAYRPTLRNDGPFAENITNYDGADNILARAIPQTQNFTYDALNRLTQGTDNNTGGFGSLGYLYDPNGNRQSETRNGTATNYSYTANTNWLAQLGSETRQYNPDGSTASTTSLGALSYDGYGELTAAAGAAYAYDPFGRRNRKSAGSTATAFAYGPNSELLYEASGASTKSYVYLNGAPVARIDNNSQIYYYHDDHLGTPQAMTDSTGTTVWAARYEPFGNAVVTTSTITNNLRPRGMYADQETGLYYNWNNYYDPRIGRWLTPEKLGIAWQVRRYQANLGGPGQLPLETNPYVRVANNPLRWIDPDGLETKFNLYEGAHGAGHLGLQIGNDPSKGKYPKNSDALTGLKILLGIDVPGQIAQDDPAHLIDSITLQTTPDEENKLKSCVNKFQDTAYDLYSDSCVAPPKKCLTEIGIKLDSSIIPKIIFRNLKQSLPQSP